MAIDFERIKEHIEGTLNLGVGSFGVCCGHITMTQVTDTAACIANVGGAVLIAIQLYRTVRK